MFRTRRKPQDEMISKVGRMQEACRHGAEYARQGASTAAERMGPTAQQTREAAMERMLQAREWSAPRLEQAARYVESDLAPRVSSFLDETAHRVEPPQTSRRSRKGVMMMLAAVAALGVAGVVMTRRSGKTDPFFDEPLPEKTAAESDGKVQQPKA
ncbi:hypothetical protein [Actinomadura macrotermitis]|nr:hypothetical protein [Actinomadura macrotermitis]